MRLFGLLAACRTVGSVASEMNSRVRSLTARLLVPAVTVGLIWLAASFPASAATITSTGYAVGSPGTSTPVGLPTEYRSALGGDAIKYFITLENSSGTYGMGATCGGLGKGTCHDEGDGGGILTMHLRFAFAQALDDGDKHLKIRFEDLDLFPAHDPWYHFEEVQVAGETGWLSHLFNPLLSWDDGVITLSLLLDSLPGGKEFFVSLNFYANPLFSGRNTAEYLIAELTGTAAVPLPAAVWLFISALAGLGGLSRFQRWRGARAAA
jgi:hypothetical protein